MATNSRNRHCDLIRSARASPYTFVYGLATKSNLSVHPLAVPVTILEVQVSAKAHPLINNTLVTEVLSARFTRVEMSIINELIDAAGVTRSEWLRDVVLARSKPDHESERLMDHVLLEEVMVLRSLILNLSAAAGIPRTVVQGILFNAESTKGAEAKKRLSSVPSDAPAGALGS